MVKYFAMQIGTTCINPRSLYVDLDTPAIQPVDISS